MSEQTEEQIESVIFHSYDSPSLGTVIFMPPKETTGISNLDDTTLRFDNNFYDLQGRRYHSEHRKGQFVISKNGKKMMVK